MAPTTLSHAPPKHMNISKNMVIMAGGTEKMRDGVQGPAGASPDEMGGGGGVSYAIRWAYRSSQRILVSTRATLEGGGGVYVLTCVTHSHATQLLK